MRNTLSFNRSDGFGEEAVGSHLGFLSALPFSISSIILFMILLFCGLTRLPFTFFTNDPAVSVFTANRVAEFFAPQVLRWEQEIHAWAVQYDLDPNLVATIMQIESCGDPFALSRAGAQGLFQVMPYHFLSGENSYDPDINANRGLAYLQKAMESYPENPALALAAYNGGIAGVSRPRIEWAQETLDYMYWGEHIYADATAGRSSSEVLQQWMAAGGASLCAQAELRLASIP
jgi:soluble lytic murein transglycosylase-like protein